MSGSFVGVADYGSFVIAIIVFLLIPGPGNLALITSTSKGGVPGGMGATFGVIAGDQVLMWAAVAGVSAIMTAYPAAFRAVQWMGAVYLTWLGIKMLAAKAGDGPILQIKPQHYFRQALVITLLNPPAIVFYMAFFPLFVDPAQHQGVRTFGVIAGDQALMWAAVAGVSAIMAAYPAAFRAVQWMGAVYLTWLGIKMLVAKAPSGAGAATSSTGTSRFRLAVSA